MRGKECKEWEEGERKRREEGRESSRTFGRGKEKRATSPGERRRREGELFIGNTSGEQASERQRERERDRACTYFMGQDLMTV